MLDTNYAMVRCKVERTNEDITVQGRRVIITTLYYIDQPLLSLSELREMLNEKAISLTIPKVNWQKEGF